MANITKETETAFFEACESSDKSKVKELLKLVNPSSLKEWRTSEGRTCLHVAVLAGDPGFLRDLAEKVDLKELKDKQGDTALHLAVTIYSVDMVKQLVDLEADLCDCENNMQETPLNMAIRLQFLEAVELLIPRTRSALDGENRFAVHRAVLLNQVKLLEILFKFSKEKKLDSKLINLPYETATNPSDNESSRAANCHHIEPIVGDRPLHTAVSSMYEQEKHPTQRIVRGDTPLHIAARNKYERMLDLLLKIDGVNKHALNDEGKTPLDIAREVVEYHESFRIIRKLGDFKRKGKPFMYCAPQVSYEKHKRAGVMINRAYGERHNAELVVAALLATMTFTAAFTVPGGFQTDTKLRDELGSPVLISFLSFKLFLIFDCIAFFLSLFACIMWQMTSELTIGDKLFFMTITNGVVCSCFAFTAYGFMAALYTVLEHKVNSFSWVVLGSLIFITLCGILAC